MKILFAASEALPFFKTGGLGDVLGALPKSLASASCDTAVAIPLYKSIKNDLPEDIEYIGSLMVSLSWRRQYCGIYGCRRGNVRYYFLDNEYYFDRPTPYGQLDDGERFAFFSRAILEMLPLINFMPDIIHCNDWQTALIPLFYKAFYQNDPAYSSVKTVFTIHNIEYQGFCRLNFLSDVCGVSDEYFPVYEYAGCINLMKGALVLSDAITTVSETYADEICYSFYGNGLDPIIRQHKYKLCGIINGIDTDEYDPLTDKIIPCGFSASDLDGKRCCKKSLQKELGLEPSENSAIISMITRLASHKGLDLVRAVFDDIMKADVQFILLGVGDKQYEDFFTEAKRRYPGRVSTNFAFDSALSHKIYASSDIFLMPSKAEPCGLAQMIAMRYGTVPVVRKTGGLADTVTQVTPDNKGRGFTFQTYNAHDMLQAIWSAIGYYGNQEQWNKIISSCMSYDPSWTVSALKYKALYGSLIK